MCIINSPLPQQGASCAEHYHLKSVCFNEDVNFSHYFCGKLFCLMKVDINLDSGMVLNKYLLMI